MQWMANSCCSLTRLFSTLTSSSFLVSSVRFLLYVQIIPMTCYNLFFSCAFFLCCVLSSSILSCSWAPRGVLLLFLLNSPIPCLGLLQSFCVVCFHVATSLLSFSFSYITSCCIVCSVCTFRLIVFCHAFPYTTFGCYGYLRFITLCQLVIRFFSSLESGMAHCPVLSVIISVVRSMKPVLMYYLCPFLLYFAKFRLFWMGQFSGTLFYCKNQSPIALQQGSHWCTININVLSSV